MPIGIKQFSPLMQNIFFHQQMNEFHKLLDENNITLVTSGIITDVQEVDVVIKRLKVGMMVFMNNQFYPIVFLNEHKLYLLYSLILQNHVLLDAYIS